MSGRVVTVKPATSDCVAAFKSVRLAALQDTPSAFGSTYAKESQFPDAEWERRVARWGDGRSIAYLAWDGDVPCGIVAGILGVDDGATDAQLVSMWVAPSHRGRGVGRLLVNEIIGWAAAQGAVELRLTVTSNNDVASGFYDLMGFARTGKTRPYPNDPALTEQEMVRPLLR